MIQSEGAQGAESRARVENLLARYPDVGKQELRELKLWFKKEATALDVGMIASDPRLAGPYRRFAAEHIEPLKAADMLRAAALLAVAVAIVAAIVWQAT